MDPLLAGLRDPVGRPRFYAPGKHPAIQQAMGQREKLLRHPPGPDRDELLGYIEEQITMFEEGETEAKCRLLHYLEGD